MYIFLTFIISILKYIKNFLKETDDNCNNKSYVILYDRILLWVVLLLLIIGFIMVMSSSISLSKHLSKDTFYFAKRHAYYLIVVFFLSLITLRIPMYILQQYSNLLLIISILMLIIVLIFNNSINGSSRWISLGMITIQPSEISKLSLFCYLSNYLAQKTDELQNNFWGFIKPIVVMMLISGLLLAQPDLGTIIILFITTLAILFLAGAKFWQLLIIVISGIYAVILLILIEPYRIRRLTSFLNPWKDPFGSGYQLTQSFIAFGRGTFWGQGLGNSIQKMEYLPESHTDFIFSIIGEELGYFGVITILLLIFFFSFRTMLIGKRALAINHKFSGFLACSIGIWFSIQTLINVSAVVGMLPTKGLTLPLISYGGSSLIIMSTAVVFLLRIDYETRLTRFQAFRQGNE